MDAVPPSAYAIETHRGPLGIGTFAAVRPIGGDAYVCNPRHLWRLTRISAIVHARRLVEDAIAAADAREREKWAPRASWATMDRAELHDPLTFADAASAHRPTVLMSTLDQLNDDLRAKVEAAGFDIAEGTLNVVMTDAPDPASNQVVLLAEWTPNRPAEEEQQS